jgi:peptide chain release factor subunit 1
MLGEIDLRKLSEISDTKPSFVTAYLKAKSEDHERFLKKRESECLGALRDEKELKGIFNDNMMRIKEFLSSGKKDHGTKSFVIFSSSPQDFFQGFELPIDIENKLIVDTSPYIMPLAMLKEEWESFAIVLMDHSNARLYLMSSAVVTDTKKMHKDIMNKHKKGGFSQMRFQRLRKGAIDHFFKEVVDYLEEFLKKENVRRIVLAGPGSAKKEFHNYLPDHLQKRVIELVDEDFDVPEGKLISDSLESFFAKESQEENEMVDNLRAEILKGGLVAYGIDDTLSAVIEGRAELLLISMGKKSKGWKCEMCNIFRSGSMETCYKCGKEVFSVDVIEEMVEAAEGMGTTLEFIKDNDFLNQLGGVAAFLRY